MYEYYASEGQNTLPYALAELIDNSLSATANNTEMRTIEIRMLFDETLGKPAVIVLDNGRGMTAKQLNNWAVYRLSKFTRENSTFASNEDEYVRPHHVPRSLNSDISYFGVGGKQAAFFIGESIRMISKPAGSPNVHELILSKEEFERKERNKEDVYSTKLRSRKPCDFSHVKNKDENFLHDLIREESGKESFTAVVITEVMPEHIVILKDDFKLWTRELAHIYHYYIHGVKGNDMRSSSTNAGDRKIDIQVTLREKPPRCPRVLSLKEVEDDMQSLYINTAVDTFEFHAFTPEDGGTVEGVIRYHPFLYDKETYPKDPDAPVVEDDDSNENELEPPARKQKGIFTCFWNGRLIPYTTVADFEWCTRGKDSKVPDECYDRISGVLFTDDKFKVTTNKLTFVDLELKLKNRNTIFTRVNNGQRQRIIKKEFTQWLTSCHENFDKQVKFVGYKETTTREDVQKKSKQHPWTTFTTIEWGTKTFKINQLVKSQKTNPIFCGTVVKFYLYGEHKKDVFATGGDVEVALEPKALYDKNKFIPISKIDKAATEEAIKLFIEKDSAKLPEKLSVDWPEGDPWPQEAVRPAGTPLGPLKIDIHNKQGELISTMPSDRGPGKKLAVDLKVTWQENLTRLGRYTLSLKTVINESLATSFGGRELPSYALNFTIKEGCAESFGFGSECSALHVGVPVDLPLLIKDRYNHPAEPPPNIRPVLTCGGLDLSYDTVDSSGSTLTIRNVKARGKVPSYQRTQHKTFELKVTLPGLKKDTQSMKFSLLPGNPHALHVTPEDNPIPVENGNPVTFNVEIHDEAGNITAHHKKIRCQVDKFTPMSFDCSTGAGQIVTKPINLKITKGEPQMLKVQFDVLFAKNQKNIAPIVRELKVLPSTRVSSMEICSQDDEKLVLRNEEKIEWLAGGLLENLFYRLFDEAGREVPLTDEIASRIKVSWAKTVNLSDLRRGKLPGLQVPTQVQNVLFCQVSYQDQSVSFSFNIEPRPDEPARLKATLPRNTVKLGETLPGNIILELVDQYGNVTKVLTSTCVNEMTVKGEGLDQSAVNFMWQESTRSVLVTGVQFQSGSPSSREICFTYKAYAEQVIVKVTAGDPAKLHLVSGPEQPLQVLNGHGIATPFLVQLCDEWGNPSSDQRVVVEIKTSPPTLKVMANVTSQPVNSYGKATFTVNNVNGSKGYYQLEFKCSFNLKPIPGPSVNLTVIPDPSKPISLSVEYDTSVRFSAGSKFPVFSVIIVSDEGSPITNINPAALSMSVWMGEPTGSRPPDTAAELKCSKPMENEKNDRFYFRDKDIPEQAGKYTIQFALQSLLFSNPITVNVEANQPVKLGPDSQPPTPVVSYGKDIANRTLVENMTLRIMDSYGNPTGQDLDGRVAVSITNCSGDGNENLPLFEGKINRFQFSLAQGKAHITRLSIMENSPGENGSSYVLLFKPEVPMVPLAPFELPFHFYNDVDNQQKMSELSRKKDQLITEIYSYKEFFTTSHELLSMLTDHYLEASRKEADLRKELNKRNMTIAETVSIGDIDRLLKEKKTEADRIYQMPRRVFTVHDQYRGQQDVLGMVGHLAFVQDDDAARVISWQISGDMDCVITKTTAAAKRIYDITRGRQQVMPLDSVLVSHINRPLPHIRNGRNLFDPPGNPVYARDLLIHPQDQDSCKIAFKNILRDTILIDDLDSANIYRRAVVENKIPCPTILTRQGDRVSAMGKFGGAQNKAPPIERLRVFGAPLPQQYFHLKGELDLLSQYHSALQTRYEREKERDNHKKDMQSPETQKKNEEMMQKEKQLKDIERHLATIAEKTLKRGPGDAGEPSGISTKRAKQYRTHFRPTYKIAFKTVTELEWRCCPGYQGYDCREVKDLKQLQVERLPHPPSASGHIQVQPAPDQRTEGQRNHPWGGERHFGGPTGHRPQRGHGQHLEEEVQQLSQMVLDMQARMTDMSSNLRLDFQEDASKMLATLLNNYRQPASVRGAETQTVQMQDFSFEREMTQMDEVMNKISQVSDDLDSKSNTLDDLLGRVNRHDGQINLLMEAAQKQLATPPPASPGSYADLQAYLDEKIQALREELMEGMEIKLADLKNSCDYKILSVQEQCEGQETNYLSLAELMDSKETDLRNEIQDLKTKLVDPGKEDSRLLNLELRLNSTEKTVAAQCLLVEEKLKTERTEAIKDLRETLEDKLVSMEDRLTTLLVDTSTNPSPGGQPESQDALQKDINSIKSSVQTLEDRFDVLDQLCSKECKSNLTVVENIQQDFQSCRSVVDAMETSLKAQINGLGAMEGQLLNYSTSLEKVHGELSYLKGRVGGLEDALSDVTHQQTEVSQILNSTWGQVQAGAEQETKDLLELHRTQHHELRQRLDELSREVKAEADHCREQTEDVGKEIAHMDSRIVSVESLCGKLDPISGSLQRIKEGLNKHVTGLWTCVNQLNGTVRAHARDIGGLRGSYQNLQNHISNVAGDLQALTRYLGKTGVQVMVEDTGLPQGSSKSLLMPVGPMDGSLPVMETGEAGPPGKMISTKLPKGTNGSMTPVQGFAGAPAIPQVKTTESIKSSTPLISADVNMPHPPSPQKPAPAPGEKVSFSAGLTLPPFQGEIGIIRFNIVLVNDGGHYDAQTGIFTAPTDGRYLVTAVLTPQRGEKVEAVLSVSNRSIQ
ncbi:hypothetical protein L3Q82_018194, partial [Scortum barcoo]